MSGTLMNLPEARCVVSGKTRAVVCRRGRPVRVAGYPWPAAPSGPALAPFLPALARGRLTGREPGEGAARIGYAGAATSPQTVDGNSGRWSGLHPSEANRSTAWRGLAYPQTAGYRAINGLETQGSRHPQAGPRRKGARWRDPRIAPRAGVVVTPGFCGASGSREAVRHKHLLIPGWRPRSRAWIMSQLT